jgi:amiloride-sensitive sodium channel subunit alpha/amiloride-sensitive sodium channel subunit gamma
MSKSSNFKLQDKVPLLKLIKSNVLQIGMISSANGIPNALNTKHKIIKYMWIVFFLISTGACAYSIIKSFQQYFQFDVVTKVRIINEIPSTFPKITICNRNPLSTNYTLYNDIMNMKNINVKQLDYNVLLKYNSPYVTNEDRKKIGYSLEDMLISCKFADVVCNANDFEWKFDKFYGNCYDFNTGRNSFNQTIPIKKNYNSGFRAGFQLELFVGMPEYLEQYSPFKGAIIYISNTTSSPRFLNEILVSPGVETNIAISKTFVTQKDYPYSDCISDFSNVDSILYKSLITANLRYTQQDCYPQCFQSNVEKNCSCYNTLFPPVNLKNPCITSADSACVFKVRMDFFAGRFNDECSSLCPLECDRVLYSYTISSSTSMSEKYAELYYMNDQIIKSKYPGRNVTFEDIKKGLVNVKIFYEGLYYTEISETESQTVFDLISSIGGTMGLFIGISLLSFIEILEIIIEILILLFTKKTISVIGFDVKN